MAATIVIVCPECKRQNKGPAELQGKKVRCKACGHTFVIKPTATDKAAPAPKAVKTKKSVPKADHHDDEYGGKNPYQLTDVVLAPRCPQCAHEMESESAVICLNCGYNTQTRVRMKTVKTYAHTPIDWIIWLAPGVLCALLVLGLIGTVCFIWIPAGFPKLAGDAWWGHFSVQIYGSVFSLGVGWIAGKFAFKRLIMNPRPPEKFKRGGEA
jgi:DNA-directed RNA polymerase subunit RPC12/RpoP